MSLVASLIIPTFNRADILAQTLPAFLKQSVPADRYEVVIIDDGSTDRTEEVARSVSDTRVKYHRFANGGRSVARNRALAVARGDLLVFVDDDAFVSGQFLEEHLRLHESSNDLVAAGPIVEVTAAPKSYALAPFWQGYHRNPFPTCNASVKREHALKVGGFDESFTLYGWEDLEFAERLLALGLRRRFAWRAPIFHCKATTHRRAFFRRVQLEHERGAMGALFYAKNRNFRVAMMTKLWWPFRLWDACLEKIFPLDRLTGEIIAQQDEKACPSSFLQSLLLYHANVGAGRLELRRRRQPE